MTMQGSTYLLNTLIAHYPSFKSHYESLHAKGLEGALRIMKDSLDRANRFDLDDLKTAFARARDEMKRANVTPEMIDDVVKYANEIRVKKLGPQTHFVPQSMKARHTEEYTAALNKFNRTARGSSDAKIAWHELCRLREKQNREELLHY
jgi:hypothetical protein